MQLPEGPDGYELERLVMRINALVELRATDDNTDRAGGLVAEIEALIANALDSPTKHRDWQAVRPRIEELLTDLDQVLYYQQP